MINCVKRSSTLTTERSECCCLAYLDKLALIPEWSYSSENSADCRNSSSDLRLGMFPTSFLSPCFRN